MSEVLTLGAFRADLAGFGSAGRRGGLLVAARRESSSFDVADLLKGVALPSEALGPVASSTWARLTL